MAESAALTYNLYYNVMGLLKIWKYNYITRPLDDVYNYCVSPVVNRLIPNNTASWTS